jgi:hypothetical protein
MSEQNGRNHTFHAEAAVLHGRLELPLDQEIPTQTYLKLKQDGGYFSQDAVPYRLEGLISFTSAYTQVGGHDVEERKGGGWATLSTAVVEDLNILDIVTADRVVSQISTRHPAHGYVPWVSLLGSRFENLKIAGHRVNLEIDPGIFGEEPVHDDHEKRDRKMMDVISGLDQKDHHGEELPADLPNGYPAWDDDPEVGDPDRTTTMRCSLVNESYFDPRKIKYPGECSKHVINIPHFGKIYLATLCVEHSKFKDGNGIPKETHVQLSMIKVKMGCIAAGSASIATSSLNGRSHP